MQKYAAIAKQLNDLRLNLSLALPHELRTPLNAILGLSRYLLSIDLESLPEPETIQSIQYSIYDSALRMQHLIENYLLYAKLRLMVDDPKKQEWDLWQNADVIHTQSFIPSVARAKAKRAQRQDDVKISVVDAEIYISERYLQEIIEELLDNALKFSEPGTPVQITTEVEKRCWILRITDRGRGMTAEQIANIGAFIQFERAQYEQQGSGLGLSIAMLLTQLHHGDLTIESIPGQGTTVTVKLKMRA